MILFMQTFQIKMKKQNCATWLVRIKFVGILKHVANIVMKNPDSIWESVLRIARSWQNQWSTR